MALPLRFGLSPFFVLPLDLWVAAGPQLFGLACFCFATSLGSLVLPLTFVHFFYFGLTWPLPLRWPKGKAWRVKAEGCWRQFFLPSCLVRPYCMRGVCVCACVALVEATRFSTACPGLLVQNVCEAALVAAAKLCSLDFRCTSVRHCPEQAGEVHRSSQGNDGSDARGRRSL